MEGYTNGIPSEYETDVSAFPIYEIWPKHWNVKGHKHEELDIQSGSQGINPFTSTEVKITDLNPKETE